MKVREVWGEKFVESRLKEIKDLEKTLGGKRGALASQSVPRWMRRRAVSHDPRRLPRRLRDRHARERASSTAGEGGGKPKRPSRKYRRRCRGSLVSEYNRRQSAGIWLETHVWHAKRFRMTPRKWGGVRLPETPNDKGFRLAYRASLSKSLMWDLSYHRLFQISFSSFHVLKEGISPLLPPYQSLESLPLHYLPLHLFQPNSYPYGFVGSALVHQAGTSSLWMWTHPSYAPQVLELLITQFKLSHQQPSEVVNEEEDSKKENLNETKLSTRNIPYSKTPKYCGCNVSLADLSNTLNKYRIVGPLAESILRKTLVSSDVQLEDQSDIDAWCKAYYNPSNISDFTNQQKFWKETDVIPRNVKLISLVVRDPRVILPPKRNVIDEKLTPCGSNSKEECEDLVFSLSRSPLWDMDVRDSVSLSKCPDHLINKRRSELLIPGSELPLTRTESRIPILIIQRDFNCGNSFSKGWDVITPAGWGLPLWINFVMYGSRVGGQKELENFDLERELLSVPMDSPDSLSGKEEADNRANLDTEVYFRYPPDKRCNYNKLGFLSPFLPRWDILVNDWLKEDMPLVKKNSGKLKANDTVIEKFYVLRDPEKLDLISKSKQTFISDPKCLVQVRIEIIGKGTIENNSGLFLPSKSDLAIYSSDQTDWHLITEPVQEDSISKDLRNTAKYQHKAKKINLRRRWKRIKEKILYLRQKNLTEKNLDGEICSLQVMLDELKQQREKENLNFNDKMRLVWMNDEVTDAKDTSSRPTCGYIVKGNFSLNKGVCVGIGYVAYSSLKFFNTDNILLVRNNSSFQYRFAKAHIIIDNDAL